MSRGPLSTLDRAFALARASAFEVCAPAWAGGALFAAVVLGVYYLERVEGIHTLRLPLALLLVLGWWGRALLVGRAARHVAGTLAGPPAPRGAFDVLRTAMVVGFGLWTWSWLLTLGSLAGPLGLLAVAPLLVLRGAFAPSWIARASCEPGAGWRALASALRDQSGRRFAGVLVEAMLLAGALGLALNLYASTAVVMLFGRSFAGFELASLETFLSPSNTFVLLVVVASALVALEPVRAAVSALFYVDARIRAEGLDLRAAIDEAVAHGSRRPGARAVEAAIVLLALTTPAAALGQAAPPPAFPAPPMEGSRESAPPPLLEPEPVIERSFPSDPGPMPKPAPTAEDRAVDADVDAILARPEFRELAEHRGDGLRDLVERLFEWMLRSRDDVPRFDAPNIAAFALPGASFFLGFALLLVVGVGTYLWMTRKKEKDEIRAVSAAVTTDPRDRAPAAFLDEAAQLADEGDLRAALRALYLATLVALDRRRAIAFDPHLTNWQYLRQMPRGDARDAFAQFTRLFDHKWYGLEPTERPDYERCRALAREIVDGPKSEAA